MVFAKSIPISSLARFADSGKRSGTRSGALQIAVLRNPMARRPNAGSPRVSVLFVIPNAVEESLIFNRGIVRDPSTFARDDKVGTTLPARCLDDNNSHELAATCNYEM